MFRFFRKHSWILVVTLTLTIISFVVFMGKAPSRSANGRAAGDFGVIYGHTITADMFARARNDFLIYYWIQTGEWADRSPRVTPLQLDAQVYQYLIKDLKAQDLGIHVDEDSVATIASDILRSPGLLREFGTTQPVPPTTFVQQVLNPMGLTAADFEHSVRAQIADNQLVELLGLPGALMTPQEADKLYDQENQQVSAQAVFFSASNYLSSITVPPAVIGEFYTNNVAAYREPDRVVINYVAFDMSNYLAQAKAELARTNFEDNVESVYEKYGSTEFADQKTPEAAKAKIRDLLIKRRALQDADLQANDFVTALYAMSPVNPENLATLAKQRNLQVITSAPFGQSTGPLDFDAPAALTKAAFQLNSDSPYTGPIPGEDAIYVIALDKQLPSAIPSFDEIRGQVTRDFEMQEAIAQARTAGTNFIYNAAVQSAMGKKFAQIAAAKGLTAVDLSPFSLSSSEVPGLDGRAELSEIKQAAFTTQPGKISRFFPTQEGGFILSVQSVLPVDQSEKSAEFPKFLAQARRAGENEAFNLWLGAEFNREIRSTPFLQEEQAAGAK